MKMKKIKIKLIKTAEFGTKCALSEAVVVLHQKSKWGEDQVLETFTSKFLHINYYFGGLILDYTHNDKSSVCNC